VRKRGTESRGPGKKAADAREMKCIRNSKGYKERGWKELELSIGEKKVRRPEGDENGSRHQGYQETDSVGMEYHLTKKKESTKEKPKERKEKLHQKKNLETAGGETIEKKGRVTRG